MKCLLLPNKDVESVKCDNKCVFVVICAALCLPVCLDMALGVWSSLSLLRRASLPLHQEQWPRYHSDSHQASLWCYWVAHAKEELQSSSWTGDRTWHVFMAKDFDCVTSQLYFMMYLTVSLFPSLFFSPHSLILSSLSPTLSVILLSFLSLPVLLFFSVYSS